MMNIPFNSREYYGGSQAASFTCTSAAPPPPAINETQALRSPSAVIWNQNATYARLAVARPAISNFSSRLFSSHLSNSSLSVLLILILPEIGLLIGCPADYLVIAAPDNLWLPVGAGGGGPELMGTSTCSQQVPVYVVCPNVSSDQ